MSVLYIACILLIGVVLPSTADQIDSVAWTSLREAGELFYLDLSCLSCHQS